MKKLVAILLSMLLALLPAFGLADAMVVSWQADEAGVRAYLEQIGMDEKGQQTVAPAAAALMNALKLRVDASENGYCASVLIDGEELFAMSVWQEDGVEMANISLLPGVTLCAPAISETQVRSNRQRNLHALAKMDEVFERWSATVEHSTVSGPILGDAYEGGASYTTLVFDDRDLAVLVLSLSDLFWMPEEAEDLLEQLSHEVAMDNQYHYRLRLVDDEHGESIGLSLTVYEQDEQMATLSLGWSEQVVKAVMGYGLDGHTIFDTLVLEAEERADGEMTMNFILSEIMDDQGLGYAAASQMPECELTRYQNILKLVSPEGAKWLSWILDEQVLLDEIQVGAHSEGGLNLGDFCFSNVTEVTSGAAQTPAFICSVEWVEAEKPVFAPQEQLINLENAEDLDDALAAQLQEVVKQGVQEMLATLLQRLPFETTMFLMEMMN